MIAWMRRLILPMAIGGVAITSLGHFTGLEIIGSAKDSIPTETSNDGALFFGSRGWLGRTGSGFGFGK